MPRRRPRSARDRARWGTVPAALLLALGSVSRAATAPAEVVNVATAEYVTMEPPGTPPGSGLPPPSILVPSNPVVTRVLAGFLLDPFTLEVAPAGTVAPGARLRYTLRATNASGFDVDDVTFALPLDTELLDPLSIDGTLAARSGPATPVTGSFDAPSRTVRWTVSAMPDGSEVDLRIEVDVRPDAPADSAAILRGEARAQGFPELRLSNEVVTPIVPPVLSAAKTADRPSAAPGDVVVFTVAVAHTASEPALASAAIVDLLPEAFRYVPASARSGGVAVPDPSIGGDGRTLRFDLGPLAPGDAREIRFAARVVATPRMEEAVNRARGEGVTAGGAAVASPYATAVVRIVPGPFRREGHAVGRVFLDENGDGLPAAAEPGVPGVLVVFEDGRGAITDVTGRWHVEGVRPGLHVLRLDPATLDETLRPSDGGADWAGDRGTRFLEVRAATVAVADFPLGPSDLPRCELRVGSHRLTLLAAGSDERAAAWLDLAAAHFASLGATASDAVHAACGDEVENTRALEALRSRIAHRTRSFSSPGSEPRAAEAESAFEPVLRSSEIGTAILFPRDGERLRSGASRIEVLYPAGSLPDLRVNGVPVPATLIGTTSTLPSRGLSASRYVGVRLASGRNLLSFRASPPDPDGEQTDPLEVWVHVPDVPVALRVRPAEGPFTADGVSVGRIAVEAVDSAGVRAAEDLFATVEIEGARVSSADDDPATDGFQVRLRDGHAEIALGPFVVPGRVRVRAQWRETEAETEIRVAPGAGGWRVFGLAEGRLAGEGGIEGDGGLPPGLGEAFSEDGGRIALLARGPVGSASRLTLSIDTERERDRDRLFGFPEPDAYFPVYGDASVPTHEAERQGPVYARLDGPWGFAVYGDFATGFDRTELARYDRRLPGLAARAERNGFAVEGFAASTDQVVVRDLFAPDGTSGPYLASRPPVVARSESVVLEVRDRFRSDVVVSRKVLRADLDYTLDPEAGTLLFRGPVAPFDRELRPQRLIVVYETRAPGASSTAAGARFSFRRGERFEGGVSAVREGRQGEDLSLFGLDLVWRPRPGAHFRGEIAASDDGGGFETALALEGRARLSPALRWEAAFRDLPAGFSNPTLFASPEIGGRRAGTGLLWEPPGPWRAKGEISWQEDLRVGLERLVASIEGERRIERATLLGAVRHVESSSPALGDSDSTLIEAGVRGRIAPRLTAELLRRESLGGETAPGYPTRTLAGLVFDLATGNRLFLRHEIETGDGPDRDRTVAGIESRVGARTKALAQYALDGGADGAALRASAGIETVLPLGPLSSVTLAASRIETTRGDDRRDFTTLSGGWERRAGDALLSARYEIHLGETETRHLLTSSGAIRPSPAWTLFARERAFVADPEAGGHATRIEGLFGAAYRPLDSPWQFLVRLDHEIGGGSPVGVGGIPPGGVASEPFGSAASVPRLDLPSGIGTVAPRSGLASLRDAFSLRAAVGARLDARQRLAAALVVRRVAEDRVPGADSSWTHLLSLHYTAEVHPRWTVGGSLRRLVQHDSETASHGAGIEVGWLALRNLWFVGGYNVAGFRDAAWGASERTDRGPFLSVRFKFDERTLSAGLRDMRLDRP